MSLAPSSVISAVSPEFNSRRCGEIWKMGLKGSDPDFPSYTSSINKTIYTT